MKGRKIISSLEHAQTSTFGWLVAGADADLLREKSTANWLAD
jgi:hypothetical protein